MPSELTCPLPQAPLLPFPGTLCPSRAGLWAVGGLGSHGQWGLALIKAEVRPIQEGGGSEPRAGSGMDTGQPDGRSCPGLTTSAQPSQGSQESLGK